MNIFKIKILDWTWDCYDSHIIVANDRDEVRILAKEQAATEGKEIWNKAIITIVGDYTGDNIKPFILNSSFNAG